MLSLHKASEGRLENAKVEAWERNTQRNNASLAATNKDQDSIQHPLSLWLVMQWAVLMNGFIAQKIFKVDIAITTIGQCVTNYICVMITHNQINYPAYTMKINQ